MASKAKLNSIDTMANEIRIIYNSDISKAEKLIETYLEQRLKKYLLDERLGLLEKLIHQFKSYSPKTETTFNLEAKDFSRLFSLLLGKGISMADLSSTEITQKLAISLNTIFDTINQIIRVMNNKLLGKEAQPDETIRGIIGSNLKKEGTSDSLQSYLDQIQKAFLVAHQAFQQAAQTKMKQMLDELDPNRISALSERGLKFGPFRKAELFEIYKEKFQICKAWSETGRFTNELLREFEKICQKSYKMDTRNIL